MRLIKDVTVVEVRLGVAAKVRREKSNSDSEGSFCILFPSFPYLSDTAGFELLLEAFFPSLSLPLVPLCITPLPSLVYFFVVRNTLC